MEYTTVIAELRTHASAAHKARVIRLGIPEAQSLGVPMPEIRRIARNVIRSAGRSNDLAHDLWATGIHEARLLAALVFDPATLPLEEAAGLIDDVVSWDLCDHLCKNLYLHLPDRELLIARWWDAEPLYTRRAAFALIASIATHERALDHDSITSFLTWIEDAAEDPRPHVHKAVEWSLREVGQRNIELRDRALAVAERLRVSPNTSKSRVGRLASKFLSSLVEAKGRRRLVTA